MRAAVARALRRQLGDEPADALVQFVAAAGSEWKEDVLNTAADRFERRLVEETSKLRVETAEQGAATRGDILKWSFLFWIGQVAATAALLAFMLRAS